jgi:hypothetical protein
LLLAWRAVAENNFLFVDELGTNLEFCCGRCFLEGNPGLSDNGIEYLAMFGSMTKTLATPVLFTVMH